MSELSKKPAPTPAQEIGLYLKNREKQIQSSLPTGHKADRFIQVALSCIMRNPALANTTPASFYSSVQWLSEMGLEPGGPDQLAYLVPYKEQCTPQVGYRGMIQIALNSGSVKKVNAVVVYENDEFDYWEGLEPGIKHKPVKSGPRGAMKFAYAYAVLPSGEHQFIVMNEEDIAKHRARSLAAKSEKDSINMWRDFPEAAWKKTALRELYKYLPHNYQIARAVERDINAEQGKVTDIQAVTIDDLAVLPTKSAELAEKVAGDRAAMDAEVVAENHDLDEIVRCCREAQSPLELSGPKNMLSRLTNANDKKLAEKAIADREADFNRGRK